MCQFKKFIKPKLSFFYDNKIYHKMCDLLSIDPELKDDASYMQIMNYCFIAYFELQPLAPRLVKTWK